MNKYKILCYALALQLVLGLTLVSAQAPTRESTTVVYKPKVELSWEYPKTEEQHIEGFRIYLGKVPKPPEVTQPSIEPDVATPYDKVFEVGPTQRQIILELAPGEYFFNAVPFGLIDGTQVVAPFTEEINALRGLMGVVNFRGVIKVFEVPIE